jgi:hypothetical protein
MTIALLVLGGKEYVVVPRKEYERLTQAEQDRRDGAKAMRALKRFRAGTLKTVSHEAVKKALGL